MAEEPVGSREEASEALVGSKEEKAVKENKNSMGQYLEVTVSENVTKEHTTEAACRCQRKNWHVFRIDMKRMRQWK